MTKQSLLAIQGIEDHLRSVITRLKRYGATPPFVLHSCHDFEEQQVWVEGDLVKIVKKKSIDESDLWITQEDYGGALF